MLFNDITFTDLFHHNKNACNSVVEPPLQTKKESTIQVFTTLHADNLSSNYIS